MCCFTLFNLQGTRSCSPLSRTAYIYYHKLFRLSTPFFIFLCKPEFAKIRSKLLSLEANLFIILRCSWFVKHFFLTSDSASQVHLKEKALLKWAWPLYYAKLQLSSTFSTFLRERKSAAGSIRRRFCALSKKSKKYLTIGAWHSIVVKLTWGALFLSDEPEKLNHW